MDGKVFQIEAYMQAIIEELKKKFGDRLHYVGLQGSYLRGEATEASDIDVMAVIDGLTIADLDVYREVVNAVGYSEKACGFICGCGELRNWNPLEICHLLHTTKDCYGTLAGLVPAYTRRDIIDYVKMSLNNLYHEICHRYIYEGQKASIDALPGMYKSVFFILQNINYLETGVFSVNKRELLGRVAGLDRKVLQAAMELKAGECVPSIKEFSLLFDWCREAMGKVEA